jgi:hypothetical protein
MVANALEKTGAAARACPQVEYPFNDALGCGIDAFRAGPESVR